MVGQSVGSANTQLGRFDCETRSRFCSSDRPSGYKLTFRLRLQSVKDVVWSDKASKVEQYLKCYNWNGCTFLRSFS